MQFAGVRKPPTGIIYDSDLGSNIDSVLALALLHGFEGKNEARIAALSINNPDLKAAQLCDVIEKFYASATTGIAAAFFQGLPVGLAADGKESGKAEISTALLAKQDSSGKPLYSPRIHKMNDTAIAEVLMRNALSAQYDQNAAMVLAGPATNLVKLLEMPGAKELIQSKVKFLVVAGGNFSSGKQAGDQSDSSFLADPAAAKRLLSGWPTPIIASGHEIGSALPFPAASIEKDFGYSPAHPVAEAYRACHSMPYDAPTSDMAAVLYAVRPKEGCFQLSTPGEISIGGDGRAAFQASEAGKHRYLVLDPAQKEKILKTFTELASAKPVPRVFRRPVVAADKVDENADESNGNKQPAKKPTPEAPPR